MNPFKRNNKSTKIYKDLYFPDWHLLPKECVMHIFQFLTEQPDVANAGKTCRNWDHIAHDQIFWRRRLLSLIDTEQLSRIRFSDPRHYEKEYYRLTRGIPCNEVKTIDRGHVDEVLHVSFSHNGSYFATTSKDNTVQIWRSQYPYQPVFKADMTNYNWRYTQFSSWNSEDRLLLVSSVNNSQDGTEGGLAVFYYVNPENTRRPAVLTSWRLICLVKNRPYDIFGCWYDSRSFISGELELFRNNIDSRSILYLNKVNIDGNADDPPLSSRPLFVFQNYNASTIRSICIAAPKLPHFQVAQSNRGESSSQASSSSAGALSPIPTAPPSGVSKSASFVQSKKLMYNSDYYEALNTGFEALAAAHHDNTGLDAAAAAPMRSPTELTIDSDSSSYASDLIGPRHWSIVDSTPPTPPENDHYYPPAAVPDCDDTSDFEAVKRIAELRQEDIQINRMANANAAKNAELVCEDEQSLDGLVFDEAPLPTSFSFLTEANAVKRGQTEEALRVSYLNSNLSQAQHHTKPIEPRAKKSKLKVVRNFYKKFVNPSKQAAPPIEYPPSRLCQAETTGSNDSLEEFLPEATERHSNPASCRAVREAHSNASRRCQASAYSPSSDHRILIFTTGRLTYIPHVLACKRIPPEGVPPEYTVNDPETFDSADKEIDMRGHIIGMGLTPDERFLYVNVRSWEENVEVAAAFEAPDISTEIKIHVIDVVKFERVGQIPRSSGHHMAFTPNDSCFFLYIDVSAKYIVSGAEDKRGYIFDRTYGHFLAALPHTNVVNAVAINPTNEEMIVSVSDDHTIKVWVSNKMERQIQRTRKNDGRSEDMSTLRLVRSKAGKLAVKPHD